MQISLTGVDIGLALVRSDVSEMMVILSVVAELDAQNGGVMVGQVAARHNGSDYHALVAPFLRSLADAIDGQG